MANIENILESQVGDLTEKLEELKAENPDLKYKFFSMDDQPEPDTSRDIQTDLAKAIDDLFCKLDRIFGGHCLIDGQWVDITKKF